MKLTHQSSCHVVRLFIFSIALSVCSALSHAQTITGALSVCVGSTTTLSASRGAGTWSIGSVGVATIGAGGAITGVSAGTATVTYTLISGSFATAVVTVNGLPAAISGPGDICYSSTGAYTDATTGGAWSITSTGIATIGSGTGIVTPVTTGTVSVIYTLPTGCSATYPVTISTTPAAISGPGVICSPATAGYADAMAGGTWSVSNTSVITITSGSGVATPISYGTANISYSVPGCGVATYPVTVAATPASIMGSSTICTGSTATYSDATTGGAWSIGNPAVGSITPAGGVATGIVAGTTTITYTAASSCYSTYPVTVSSSPAAITGSPVVCAGGTATLSDATAGGTWSSSNSAILTVTTAGGVVTGTVAGYSATISYTLSSGCFATYPMTVTPTPTAFTITGGGAYCSGGTGVPIGLTGSQSYVSYQLYNGGTATGSPITGAGFSFNFPSQTAPGIYTIVANPGTSCSTTMTGSVTVTINPLPTVCTVVGGGTCGSGTVGLATSSSGINYQLFLGTTPVGVPLAGTGTAISFGLQTTPGVYKVMATNPTTGCTDLMADSAVITSGAGAISGTLTVCVGGTTTLSASGTGGGAWSSSNLVIATVGSGSGIVAGMATGAAVITYAIGSCYATATVTVTAAPAAYTVSGGGAYCSGGAGVNIYLSASQIGVTYQLYDGGSPVGSIVLGTGAALTFGPATAAGTYTIAADPATSCATIMTGSVTVSINPLPAVFTVTGGGACSASVGIVASQSGVTYSLYDGSSLVGSASGTGGALSFGTFSASGTYSVTATVVATGCSGAMAGSATISSGAGPISGTLSVCIGSTTTLSASGSGSWTSGSTGVAAVGSTTGIVVGMAAGTAVITYTLPGGCFATATVTVVALPGDINGAPSVCVGSAASLSSSTGGGTWSINPTTVATISSGGMVSGIAAGTATVTYGLSSCFVTRLITVNPMPAPISGANTICVGSTSAYSDATPGGIWSSGASGIATIGSASGLAAGIAAGTGAISYTLPSGCLATHGVTVTTLSTPISGPATLCSGSTATYTNTTTGGLWSSSNTAVATIGSATGIASGLSAGVVTISYTVSSSCYATHALTVNASPSVYSMTGGGVYCPYGAAVTVGLSNSQSGVSYQLYKGGTAYGSPVSGTGAAFSFGTFTTAGTFTCTANPGMACAATMSGSAVVTVYTVTTTLPALLTVGGGGSFCAGSAGIAVTLPGSSVGFNYELYRGGVFTGTTVAGTGTSITFGLQTVPGIYTAEATSTITGCTSDMTGSATLTEYPAPNLYTVTGGGAFCSGGTGVTVGLSGSQSGINYQLYDGSATVGSTHPGTGAAISFGYETTGGTYTVKGINATTACTAIMTGSAVVSVNPLPTISGSTYLVAPGATITLTGSPSGGTWTSSTHTVATIGSSSGIVTGVSLGSTTITYSGSCSATHTISVTPTGHRGTSATNGDENTTIIPNPNHGTFTISGTMENVNEQEVTLELANILGQVIYTDKFTAYNGNINREVQLNNIAPGNYLLVVRTAGYRQAFHIAVQ